MPNPKRRHSPSRRDSRRASNWRLEVQSLGSCSQCGAAKRPHRVCMACGFYNGRLALNVKDKTKKKRGGQPE
ncbi:MAG: 50S ribosomal protein L32 [Elusimicrobia bacterium]|nr:50S ribosomal protein L32 [Elusimicrobiota bacterium]